MTNDPNIILNIMCYNVVSILELAYCVDKISRSGSLQEFPRIAYQIYKNIKYDIWGASADPSKNFNQWKKYLYH